MEIIIPILVIVLIFGRPVLREIKDYLLKKEQIKADALVRAEELRLKNQYELEKLIQKDQSNNASQKAVNEMNIQDEDHSVKNKLRY